MYRQKSKIINLLKHSIWFHISVLSVVFFSMYYPHTLILNENIETIAAFEIDASDMIKTTLKHIETFNTGTEYKTFRYGWTYFTFSTLLIKPIQLIDNLFQFNFDSSYYIFLIRNVFFLFSFLSLLALYFLLVKLSGSSIIALALSSFYLFPSLRLILFVDLKPETVGLFFLFLSQIFLFYFLEAKKSMRNTLYIAGVVSLILSVLSKQSFLFTALPVFSLYLWYDWKSQRVRLSTYFMSNHFSKLFLTTLIIGFFMILIVVPALFLHTDKMIKGMTYLFSAHTEGTNINLSGSSLFKAWFSTIRNNPLLVVTGVLWPISVFLTIKQNSKLKIYYLVHLLCFPLILFILTSNATRFIILYYLTPLYSYILITLLIPILSLVSVPRFLLNKFFRILLVIFGVMIISSSLFAVHQSLKIREGYKSSDIMILRNYIEENIPKGSKIAISDSILLPSKTDYDSCHWWSTCTNLKSVENFQPEFLIFINNRTFNGVHPNSYLSFREYIKNENFSNIYSLGKFVIYSKSDDE